MFFYFSKTLSHKQHRLQRLKKQYQEFVVLSEKYFALEKSFSNLKKKQKIKTSGIVEAVDKVFSSLGLKNKLVSVKFVARNDSPDILEEKAEVRVSQVNMNEMVNIFYRFENIPLPIVLKKVSIQPSFEGQHLFDLDITVSLVYIKK
ncbi:MAG: hypothetical protein LWW94_05870 [Candidatus Desulfofervidaceae bacterium]|nr:hypothetical protein [Candidatus Desulfofervidaceae bacterium]